METVKLNNGVEIPLIGYGTFKVDPNDTERCVRDAINVGYRMIDTAQFYANEEQVGCAISGCGVPRGELFLITKVWMNHGDEIGVAKSIDDSLRNLKTDYVDLLLVHHPFGDYYSIYRALEKAYAAGKTRAIGLSNFYDARFVDLVYHSEVAPAVNQLETNVFSQQNSMREQLKRSNTCLMSWGPMGQGKYDFFNHPVLMSIGEKYGKTVSQVGLRFLIQQGIPVIPKSVNIERMAENMNVFDFMLDDADMEIIRGLNINDKGTRDFNDPVYAEKIVSQVF